MLEAVRQLALFAVAQTPLILVGATGTGKTFMARLAHQWSGRRGQFRTVTAGELRGSLYHDMLFGHEAGAFTGARQRRQGLFGATAGGTLLLDDFHHLSPGRQTSLLRVLEDGQYTPLGCDRELGVRSRVMLGVREEPGGLVRRGRMLEEIRSRIGYCAVRLPSLAERRPEIPLFVQRFLALCPADTGVPGGPRCASEAALEVLSAVDLAGNLRDLRNVVRAAYLVAHDREEIGVEHLPTEVVGLKFVPHQRAEANCQAVTGALRRTGGNASAAARLLGVHRNTVVAAQRRLRQATSAG